MKLTVVGCSGSYPGPDSPASSYLVEAEGPDLAGTEGARRTWRILLDLGSGALGALQRYADPLSIDAVFLSHLHADHCLDLCGYYVLRTYHPDGLQPRIPVWGPQGVAARMARAYDLPEDPGMTPVFDFHEYAGPVALGPFMIEPVAVQHPIPAYALRVTVEGSALAYSGDTALCAGLHSVAVGVDLLLAEASFRDGADNPEGIHLTGGDCGAVATEAGVDHLVLTHIPPWHDPATAEREARRSYAGRIDIAHAGAVYDLPNSDSSAG